MLPSAVGQSLCCMIRTGLTSHQIALALTRSLSTTWLWFGVGTKTGAVGGPGYSCPAFHPPVGVARLDEDEASLQAAGFLRGWVQSGLIVR